MNENKYLDELVTKIREKEILLEDFDESSLESKENYWKKAVLVGNLKKWDSNLISLENKFLKNRLVNSKIFNCYELNDAYQLNDKIFIWCGNDSTICIDAIAIPATFELCNLESKYLYDLYYYNGIKLRLKCLDVMGDTKLVDSELVITRSYNVLSDYIIHVNYSYDNQDNFKKAILNILECCRINMIKTIMICLDKEEISFYQEAYEVTNDYLDKFGIMFDKVIFKADRKITKDELENIEN